MTNDGVLSTDDELRVLKVLNLGVVDVLHESVLGSLASSSSYGLVYLGLSCDLEVLVLCACVINNPGS